MTTITQPGVYDLPDDVYHADPVAGGSLSSTGARSLLPPSCPARFAWEREHGRAPKRHYDLGHAAHLRVLGAGPEIVLVDRPRWDTKEVKAEVAELRAAGKVPLKRDDWDCAQGMADALRLHPFAGKLFDPERGGAPEQTLVWHGHDVWLRARLDWLPAANGGGRLVIPDYKTTKNASPGAIRKAMAEYGYHIQEAFYLAGVDNLDIDPDAAFLFVFQETEPPYLVTVVELDDDARQAGHAAMSQAIRTYDRCTRTGQWPGYAEDIEEISLPPWVTRYYDPEEW